MDAFNQVSKLFEEQERELDNFLAQAEVIAGKNYHEVEIGGPDSSKIKGRLLTNVIKEENGKQSHHDEDEDDLLL